MQSDQANPRHSSLETLTQLFGQKRTFSTALSIELDESESLKRIKSEDVKSEPTFETPLKIDCTPQKTQPNIILDRSAISEVTEPGRPASEAVANPMLKSLLSRQKRARHPGTTVSDSQKKLELLQRFQDPKASNKEIA